MATQLYGIAPTDARTYGIVAALVLITAAAAAWWPARSAARVDPASALRSA